MDVRLLVTPGDPRGIGPEVALRGLSLFSEEEPDADVTVIGPDGLLGLDALSRLAAEGGSAPCDDTAAGTFAAAAIERAVEAALGGEAHGVVTAPLHKPSLHAAGRLFPGQTEMLAELTDAEPVGMLMAAETTRLGAPLRVLLGTTHLPLRDVPDAFTADVLRDQAELLNRALSEDWGFASPVLGICALNPHASDGGLFGDEEARVYAPAMEAIRDLGIRAVGPLPADTVFARALDGEFDAVVAPYHDVGMAAFKTIAFGSGVNVTLGLPFIRTSPDHGTAFDIAGTGAADPTSMLEALRLAYRLSKKRFDTPCTDV